MKEISVRREAIEHVKTALTAMYGSPSEALQGLFQWAENSNVRATMDIPREPAKPAKIIAKEDAEKIILCSLEHCGVAISDRNPRPADKPPEKAPAVVAQRRPAFGRWARS